MKYPNRTMYRMEEKISKLIKLCDVLNERIIELSFQGHFNSCGCPDCIQSREKIRQYEGRLSKLKED
jgi:hypothetical protein